MANAGQDLSSISDITSDIIEFVYKTEFDKVEITYEMGEPETVEKDGMVMIVQNERSIVQIPDGQMERIIKITVITDIPN